MGYFNFVNGTTALNDTNLNEMQKGLMQLVFPIGSTYITQEDTNPSTILGFGTWERLKGKVCLGLDEDDEDFNTIGNTGGEKTHTLTINEIPTHNHGALGGENFVSNKGDRGGANITTGSEGYSLSSKTADAGRDQPHNNMQPYEVVGYMWIRRS